MLKNQEGNRVPSVEFKIRKEGKLVPLQSDELFKGKKVVVFALPGAFTPTCSSSHLPRYEELASSFRKHGVDNIVCLSVNDPFVMEAWGVQQGAKNVQLISDGNGEFSEKLGFLVDKSQLGFGKRSWRYSMLVNDGVIEKMFIEPEVDGDPFEVSDADTMLKYLDPKAAAPSSIALFTRAGCPHCARAKALLDAEGHSYEEIPLSPTISTRSLVAMTGRKTVPQVFVDGKHIGGADDLEKWLKK